ncbi:hypothetical protein Glove_230g158 [Diversispora epigaea]|uniref:BACK domain-containing protein n=1 Tax=Diversispora epigaea TaxID=1348612 RepID=A0A397IKI1_9GLOM|nr:hypothetical protein Glove_230g158 [Diversispora epigaea]
MEFKFLEKLSQDFSELNDKEECNVIIEVDKEQNKKTFTAHSNVLRYQNMDTRTIYDLMVVANELEFEELSEKLENHLIEFKASWLRIHFTFVHHSIFKHNKFQNLEKFCNDIIVKHPSIIFESAEFTSLHESVLVSILKRDDLQMKESEIWDYLIKWGTAQNPTLPVKLKEWSGENIMTLKAILHQCLPLIHYFQILNSDVVHKIKPYKKILDKQLWNERALMISSWIDNRITSYSLRNNPYEFQLILRGSEDGFAPRTFWDFCDGHANTIVITKVKGTDEIIDGNIQNSILSRVKNENKALWYNSNNEDIIGSYFGNLEFTLRSHAFDFTRDRLSRCCHSNNCIYNSYEKSIRTTNDYFSVIYYEVFNVRKSI